MINNQRIYFIRSFYKNGLDYKIALLFLNLGYNLVEEADYIIYLLSKKHSLEDIFKLYPPKLLSKL